MLCEIKIRLTQPMLGQQRDPSGIRRFTRTSAAALAIDHERWIWAFNEAAKALHLEVDTSALHPSDGIASPTIVLYNRKWVDRKSGSERQRQEMFESVRKGTVLTFRLAVTGSQLLPAPTPDEVKALFSYIGEFIGISQWGNRFGYGRFTVDTVTPL
jgi:hypothetical protein